MQPGWDLHSQPKAVTTIQYVWLLLHNICAWGKKKRMWFSFRFIYSIGLCVNLPCCLAVLRLENIRWKPIVSDCMYSICVILKVKPKSAHYVLGVSVWLEDGLASSPKCSAMIGSSCHCGVRYWNLAGQIALSYFDIVWHSMLCRFLFFCSTNLRDLERYSFSKTSLSGC